MSMNLLAEPGLGPVLFRVASWPIDTVDPLRSVAFTSEVDLALALEETIRARGEELSALLYSRIPRMEVEQRRVALRVRRALHRSAEPAGRSDIQTLASDTAIGERLLADDAERRCLETQLQNLRCRYAAALQREFEELLKIAGEISFRRAVAVASPGTSDALEELLRDRDKPASWRLRATLLNYVMRAAGRATPNGLWSGVALESPHDGDAPISFRNTRVAVFAKPDLNAFFELFELAASPQHYRKSVCLQWNSTITNIAESDYAYARRCDGAWVFSRVADTGEIGRLKKVLGPLERAEFQNLYAKSGLSEHALHRLYMAGVLCAACDRPGVYEDASTALNALVECLAPGERPQWQTAICELRRICTALGESAPDSDVVQFRRGISDARRIVNALRARYDAAPLPGDRSVLVFDQIAPFEFGISEDVRNQIAKSLRRCWNFDRGGAGELLARNARMLQADSTDADIALALAGISIERIGPAQATSAATEAGATSGSWEEVKASFKQPDLTEGFRDLMHAWTTDLEGSCSRSVHEIGLSQPGESFPMPPVSALLVPALMPDGLHLRVGSIAPDGAAFYGRFHHLFAARGNLQFQTWMTQSKARAEAEEVDLADVAIRGEHDRNAALRPQLGSRILDPVTAPLTDLTAEFDGERGARLYDEEGGRVFPVLHSAVETSTADPWARWFAEVERNIGRTSLLAPLPPLARELEEWKHCPRLMLDSTTVIGPERWWCPQETIEQLGRAEGFDRYLAWRRWVGAAAIPGRAYARYGATDTETLLLPDSVLAVEVLGRALSQTNSPFRLQEMFFGEAGLWLQDQNGRKYLAEMAVAWQGDGEFWRRSCVTPRS
jgi:hypothetical protein